MMVKIEKEISVTGRLILGNCQLFDERDWTCVEEIGRVLKGIRGARLARQLFTRYSLLDHSSEPRTCERVHVRYREGEKEGGKRCSL